MQKKIWLLFFFVVLILLSWCIKKETPVDQDVYEQTMKISNEYVSLRIQTDEILINAKQYSYEDRNQNMNTITAERESLSENATELEKLAEKMNKSELSFSLVNRTFAYDKQEISNIFDRAPAGKKIATLAKHLWVDAKTAFKILKNDQAQVEADARNEAWDTFQKLETSATLIKDGCKVAGFAWWIAIAGGPAVIAGGSALGQATVIVWWADLVLEVTDDASKIALWNHNKISSIISNVRIVTEPLAWLLTISDIPNNLKNGYEKFSAVMVALDQFNSAAQDGKIVWIQLPAYKPDATKSSARVAILQKEEINKRLEENNTNLEQEEKLDEEKIKELTKAIHDKLIKTNPAQEEPKLEKGENWSVIWIWEWVGTFTQSSQSQPEDVNRIINFMENNKISANLERFDDNEVEWEQEWTMIKMREKNGDGGYYLFELDENKLIFIKMEWPDSEWKRSEVLAWSDFFGGRFFQITLERK